MTQAYRVVTMKILPIVNPARPFFATMRMEARCISGELRDHTGKLWSGATGYTYSEVYRKLETSAFNFGGVIVD